MEIPNQLEPDDSSEFVAPVTGGEQENLPTLECLPAELGFTETSAMLEQRQLLIEAMTQGDMTTFRELYQNYHSLAEAITVDEKSQIGFIISRALLCRAAGDESGYREELEDALTYAETRGYDELVSRLGAELG